jgi:hypothetical protein
MSRTLWNPAATATRSRAAAPAAVFDALTAESGHLAGHTYRLFGGLLTLLGFGGAGLALVRRDVRLLAPAAVHACLAAAHALSWMDFTYLYLRTRSTPCSRCICLDAGLAARASTPVRLGALAAAAALVTLLCVSLAEVFWR